MDSSIAQQPQLDISKLSDYEKRDLQQTLNNEIQKAKLQESIHNHTDTCWKKCITGKISDGKLTRSEESCTQNCVDRYMEAQEFVLRHLGAMRGQGDV